MTVLLAFVAFVVGATVLSPLAFALSVAATALLAGLAVTFLAKEVRR